MTDDKTLRAEIAEEIAGVVVGRGYYATSIGIDEAMEAVDLLLARFDIRERSAEPSEAAVEAVARALFDLELGWDVDFNTEVHENVRDRFVKQARAALTAARAVTEGS